MPRRLESNEGSSRRSARQNKAISYEGMDDERIDEQNPVTEYDGEMTSENTASRRSSSEEIEPGTRKSSRSNKYSNSMAEPTSRDFRVHSDDEPLVKKSPPRRRVKSETRDSLTRLDNKQASPTKSPAKRHAKKRLSLPKMRDGLSDTERSSASSSAEGMEEEDENEEPIKIQRIIAARTETRAKWREICSAMNTSEIENGSRWFQETNQSDQDNVFEERFLVKWSHYSYLHCSWETQDDLLDQIDGAKSYFSIFFRKSVNGVLFSPDERNDGDYFDPAFTQIDRILEVQVPEGLKKAAAEWENEETNSDFGIILDRNNKKFEDGTGRQFLIKWGNTPYSESTYEFERDLILNDIEYKEPLNAFLTRSKKPSKEELRNALKKGDEELRRLYKTFSDRIQIDETKKEALIQEFQQKLQEHVYKNGGQIRDYQAEGIAWMTANYVNSRSSILADEMGLGKTLQTVATLNFISIKINPCGVFLVVAPLSTLAHWKREFEGWTDLNTIVYHGSGEDRMTIREFEMAYEEDRPKSLGYNQYYLKKCLKKNGSKADHPWMVDVVITTPEMLVAEDANELASIEWDVLIVDEAHRLKNHNSKLAVNLRNDRFTFNHRILLTGTPIQNDVKEFWTLLNFIDPNRFQDGEAFIKRYGDMKSKERVDELHEEIRPYILRRLKEDVEKSVPPKEETLIEVELTLEQKQYYRALYEKNVKFLHKNKRALDGPSLNNLAMQLRKCCNHLFLLNGVEEEFRAKNHQGLIEGDLLVKGSGKLVLLDKLLPRLKSEGHRVLLFSQFKIMLDLLEDYLESRSMKYERIDGSITGHKRQQAIDRFQSASISEREAPFVMLLSTRAGGVGINLTAADTVVIFDSDWNPQNDLQAQARCHRIGQTKDVKIYRLLTRKTYEMQMFHMSSLKMGLDQAVLKGFETGSSSEGALSKEEVERLLRHGAYDIFNEEKTGSAEAESNAFVQQDIDSILQRRARTVIHESTGSGSNAEGSTFSKARFTAHTPSKGSAGNDIDIEDPDFWKKVVGEGDTEKDENILLQPRKRGDLNYSENAYLKELERQLHFNNEDSESETDDESSAGDHSSKERARWGGVGVTEWSKDDAETLVKGILAFGFGNLAWNEFISRINLKKVYDETEVKRMTWSMLLLLLLEYAQSEVITARKREERAAEKKLEDCSQIRDKEGGSLAVTTSFNKRDGDLSEEEQIEKAFQRICISVSEWLPDVVSEAVKYARQTSPRDQARIDEVKHNKDNCESKTNDLNILFVQNVWPSLKSRGWKGKIITEGVSAGLTTYSFGSREFSSIEEVVKDAKIMHPELSNVIETVMEVVEEARRRTKEYQEEERKEHLALAVSNLTRSKVSDFLWKYAPLQLLADRKRPTKIHLSRKLLSVSSLLRDLLSILRNADKSDEKTIRALESRLHVDKRTGLPHPLWKARHDAVLLVAIRKHGWIDAEASYRSIIEDRSLPWGHPFNKLSSDEKEEHLVSVGHQKVAMRSTAERAAKLVSEKYGLCCAAKDFDLDTVIKTYSLEKMETTVENYGTEVDGKTLKWRVIEEDLFVKSTPEMNSIDLPSQKELAKRARSVISRNMESKGLVNNEDSEQNQQHQFSVLDQSDPCNTLLAVLLRAIVKEKSQGSLVKDLCKTAIHEARSRAMDLGSFESDENNRAVDELNKIASHIELAKNNMQKAATQSKNVIRAILGEKIHDPRKAQEALFPTEEKKPYHKNPLNATKPINLPSKSFFLTTSEQMIASAIKIAEHQGGRLGAATKDTVQLTEIEATLLSVLAAVGLPCWLKQWKMRLREHDESEPFEMSWEKIGRLVYERSMAKLDRAQALLIKRKEQFEKLEFDPSKFDERFNAEQALWDAQRAYDRLDEASSDAAEYAVEPENMAKKAIMLLAKMQHTGGPVTVNSFTTRCDDGLGPKVLKWFENDISGWGGSLELLDQQGLVLGFTAADFINELPADERANVEIIATFDKKSCRAVLSQVAMLTRCRSILLQRNGFELQSRFEQAAENLKMQGDKWEQQPDWWASKELLSSTVSNDLLLVQRLTEHGFEDILDSTKNFGIRGKFAGKAFKEMKLQKGAIQLRANQLVRELHNMEETPKVGKAPSDTKSVRAGAFSTTQPAKLQGSLLDYFAQADSTSAKIQYHDVEIIESPSARKRKSDDSFSTKPAPIEKKTKSS